MFDRNRELTPKGSMRSSHRQWQRVVSKGYQGMHPERSRRVERLKLTAMQRAPITYCFMEVAGSAMLWEKVRKMSEDLAGYTIRESDVGEVV